MLELGRAVMPTHEIASAMDSRRVDLPAARPANSAVPYANRVAYLDRRAAHGRTSADTGPPRSHALHRRAGAPGDAANAARAVSHHREPRSSSTSSWPPWAEQTCGAAGPSAVAHRKSVDRTLRDAATPAAQRKPRGAVTGDTPAVVGCRAPRENPRPPARHARNMSPVLPQPTLRLRATEEVVKLAGHSGCRPATSPRAATAEFARGHLTTRCLVGTLSRRCVGPPSATQPPHSLHARRRRCRAPAGLRRRRLRAVPNPSAAAVGPVDRRG